MEQNKVKFKYIFDSAYNPKYANGAFGNITPHGEVALNFYFERSALPYEQEFALDEDGVLGECVGEQPEEVSYVRYVQNGLILNKEDARGIANWLLSLVDGESEAE